MSGVVVLDGFARVMPPPVSEKATVTWWAAHLACDGDLRTKATPYRDLAARLTLQPVTAHDQAQHHAGQEGAGG